MNTRTLELLELDDVGLVEALVSAADAVEDHGVRDQLFFVIGEATERWSPQAARWAFQCELVRQGLDKANIEAVLAAMDERAKARARRGI